MTNTKRTASLDEVLADYAHASQKFDAKVLQAFIDKYPEHARALQRYAHVQLTSMPATPDEIDRELLSDEEMLPRQSKLLQRMQQLRHTPSASEAVKKLDSISGERALRAAAIDIFGSNEHGEDLLLLAIIESETEVSGVPEWFYESLGAHVKAIPAALIQGMAMKRQSVGLQQRFSAKEKPTESVSVSWEQIVEDCIFDDTTKNAILKRSASS